MRPRHRYWVHRHLLRGLLCGRHYRLLKRGLDLAVCVAVLPIVLPLMGLLALVIRLDSPGPTLMGQERTGQGGRRFKMLKFRTMVQNAEELKVKYAHLNELVWPDFKIKNDPRVTRVGRVLRKSSLDELPQVFNVLRGEMTLIGPRPTSFPASTYRLWQTQRLDARPGISGLWQVKGRGSSQFDERNRMEIEYVQHPCFLLDLKLMAQTVTSVLQRKGAW